MIFSSGSNILFQGLTFVFFSGSVHYLVKRKANSTIEQRKCKGHEKRDRFLICKMDFSC